jgi:ubiquitin-protein ligase
MNDVRQRRLAADHQMVSQLVTESGNTLHVESIDGNPPHTYIIQYRCRGIERLNGQAPIYREEHRVRIALPANYPAQGPVATMLTPIFHPHIWSSNAICLGRWTLSERLDNLLTRIGAIIQYDPQYFDFNSPANRDASAWAQRNMRLFPVGRCNFKVPSARAGEISWTNIR